MTATQDDMIAELRRANAALRQELSERDAALVQRNSEYRERIEQQAATIDVLRAMSASPGDAQPVFDLIVMRARDLCDAYGATVYEFDGTLIHWRAATGVSDDLSIREALEAMYPMAPSREWPVGRAIMNRQIIHISDVETEPGLNPAMRGITAKSSLVVPLMRGYVVIGGLAIGRRERGRFSDSQIELLKTFAEQAVIAITSAETYRALQTRTTDLRQSLEYQTATSDVLKAISRAAYDLDTVLNMLIITAVRLCEANHGQIWRKDGEVFRYATSYMNVPAYRDIEEHTEIKIGRGSLIGRVGLERGPVLIADAWNDPEYEDQEGARLAEARSMLGVPLLRDGELIGAFALARRVAVPFSDRQLELVRTFADQAVIAIENTRLLTEQREALEQQTATAEVLQVINSSPGDLAPVFDVILEKAHRLCGVTHGAFVLRDGETFRAVATHSYSGAFGEQLRRGYRGPDNPITQSLIAGARFVHLPDLAQIDHPMVQASVELAGVRTGLYVPLRKDGVLLGMITSARREIRPFTDKEIALVENFAAQAVIAMENARLINEQREALEQQAATAEVLQVINASRGDLAPVFDAILAKAHSVCGADVGMLATYDGENFHALASFGYPDEVAAVLRRPFAPGPRHQELFDGAAYIHEPDTRAEETDRDYNLARTFFEYTDLRTLLAVALRKDGKLLGFISAHRHGARPYTEKEISLLQNFAAQAVIAMENARLITETREALEQQTATAEVLQVINNSPGELAPVFDAMLDKALGLCNAAFGIFWTYDGTRGHAVALRGVPPAFAEYLTRAPHPVDPGGAHDRLLCGEPLVHIADAAEEQAYRSGNPLRRALVELGRARTLLAVPLRKDNAYLGHFVIYRREVRPFSDKQIALLQNFAAQAVIAMENARLLGELRKRTGDLEESLEYQTATSDVLKAISRAAYDLDTVLTMLIAAAARLCGATHGQIWRKDGEVYRHAASHMNVPAYREMEEKTEIRAGRGTLIGRVVMERRPVQIADAWSDPEYEDKAAARLGRGRAMLGVPLLRDGELIGAFALARAVPVPFTDRQIEVVSTFADQTVIAIENTRLITEQREALEQQTATAEVLEVINASPGNLTPVFNTMLEKAMRLCEAAFGLLFTYDSKRYHTAAQRGVPAALAEYRATTPPTAQPGSRSAMLLTITIPHHVLDITVDDYYLSGAVDDRSIADLGGARTVLYVPLRKDEATLGIIAIYRQEVRAFSDKQIALVENFAAQAVIAMESARLLNELRARTDELAQRQAELRVTFENMGDGVAMFDETQHLVAWNRKFQDILGVPDEIIARRQTFPEYVRYLAERGEYGAGADPEEQIRRLTGRASQNRAYERTRPNGQVIEIRHNPVAGGGFVLIYADITERKRNEVEIRAARDAAEAAYRELKTAQANLIQAEKMASLGQLTAGIAHEIKNPLNFVNNFAALSVDLLAELKETAAPGFAVLSEERRAEVEDVSAMLTSNLQKITEHGKRADGIVKAMLEHSRGSSGERRTVDLNALIDEALNLAYHGARAQDPTFNITLERNFDESIAPIEVNPQDMTRVFLNIFSNGFYAANRRAQDGTEAGFSPALKVTTRDAGEVVEIRVRDNGIGIPADISDQLFQPFFTTKPTGEGTGLGLSITYDIVTKAHGGTITVDSEVDKFTEFIVALPRGMFANERIKP